MRKTVVLLPSTLVIFPLLISSGGSTGQDIPAFRNPDLRFEQRAANLVSQMMLDEAQTND